MSPKKLEPNSVYAKYDADGDGVVTDEELAISARLQELEVLHEKADAQRSMVWFALFGMLLYPSGVAACSFLGLNDAAVLLSDMANMYFLATGGVVSVFFGSQVFAGRNK
jgi:hypothetical protein|tara:strand:- start:83 stop:412 length:330 start_codon:yes stop_codon:yes gene_type:complete